MARHSDALLKEFGEPLKYDPKFKGPCKRRSCTDIICLLLFVAFLATWGGVAWFAYSKGDIDRLILPTDSHNRKCGVDYQVANKPYLVFLDLVKCVDISVAINGCPTEQVCVEKCPTENFLFDMVPDTVPIEELRQKMICTVDTNEIKSHAEAKTMVDNKICARWYLKSQSVLKRCIADVLPKICPKRETNLRTSRYLEFNSSSDTRDQILKLIDFDLSARQMQDCPDRKYGRFQPRFTANDNDTTTKVTLQMAQMIVEDVVDSYQYILVALLIAMAASLIFIAMMRFIAGPMVWLSIIGVIGMLSYGVYYSATRYAHLKAYPDYNPPAASNIYSTLRLLLTKASTWMYILIALSIVLIVLLLVVIFLRKRIVIAIALIKEGSKAVSSTLSTVFFPIFPWALQVTVIVFAVTVGLYLASIGDSVFRVIGLGDGESCICDGMEYRNGDVCNVTQFHEKCVNPLLFKNAAPCQNAVCHFQHIEGPLLLGYFHAINVVGFFWLAFFVAAFGEMVLAATFATWYWTFHKRDVPFYNLTAAFFRTLRYHIGTLAVGSFIITICRIIRCILEYIDQKLKKFDNPVTKAIMCCMKCFFWMLEKFLKFINRNAYIMCAIHGKGFCSSAKNAFNLLMRNALRVVALDKVTDFLFFLSKVLIAVGMGATTYVFVTREVHGLHYNVVPVAIVTIGSYFIAHVFFGVYSMAVDTLFLCFLEDSERNDGSPEKPYFMSKQLMRILGKRNVIPRNQYRR